MKLTKNRNMPVMFHVHECHYPDERESKLCIFNKEYFLSIILYQIMLLGKMCISTMVMVYPH